MAANLTSEQYLVQQHILTYVEDAVTQLLLYKDEVPKVDIMKFFTEYFSSLKEGSHTLLREFAFICSTPYNRACFVHLFYKCFANMGKKGDLLSVREYHALVSILCPDFPFELIQKTARIVLVDDVQDCIISFVDFLYAFQLQFYYQEFLEAAYSIYQTVLESPMARSPREIIVPTDHTTEHKQTANHHSVSEGADSLQYLRALSQLQDKHSFCIPSVPSLREILTTSSTVTFYGFLVALSKNESINKDIGKLPPLAKVFDGVDINALESPKIKSYTDYSQTKDVTTDMQIKDVTSEKTVATSYSSATTLTVATSNSSTTTLRQSLKKTKNPSRKKTIRKKVIESSDTSTSSDDSDESEN